MTDDIVVKSEKRNYSELFLHDLNWGSPDHPPISLELEGGHLLTATNISSYRGLRVWEVPAVPGSAVEARLDQMIAKTTTNRLVIFHDADKQAWRWPSRTNRGVSVVSRPARHLHKTGSVDPRFAAKIDAIRLPSEVLLDVNEVLHRVRNAFDVETKNETKRASKLMARMYSAVEKAYPLDFDAKTRDHEIAVSLARILFLLFGDDTEMWTPDLFQDFIKDHTSRDGSDIGRKLSRLFDILDTAPSERADLPVEVAEFPYVNGMIFEERIALPELGAEFRDAVLDACAVDWSTISPAIFGSMFQSVRDAQTRRELGEHYTSEESILKTLNPLFLDELHAEFSRTATLKNQAAGLRRLWSRLGDIRFIDPACGCGNFIIVAYRELRDLELRIMEQLQSIERSSQLAFDPTLELKVSLDHFYGIEIDEWPAKIAETAMFLIDRQCDLKLKDRFGEAPQRLPIQTQSTIVVDNALRLDWRQICSPSDNTIVAGNPPFLGHKERSVEQGEDLRLAWRVSSVQHLDYVTAWYAKCAEYFSEHNGQWAFVSTNSVAQGESAPLLFRPLFDAGWVIKFAHRTFVWRSESPGAAAVHVVIVGFSRPRATRYRLFDYPTARSEPQEVVAVERINGYLVDGPNVLVGGRTSVLSPNIPSIDAGSTAIDWSYLTVPAADIDAVRADPVAAKYLRRYLGGKELINNLDRWCLWMASDDFDPDDLGRSRILSERVEMVRQKRAAADRVATRRLADVPHLFGEIRQPLVPYLGMPQTFTENRPYATAARLPADVIASMKLFTAPDPDGFLFALFSSSMFITWQKTVGGRLKSDPSFSASIVWNNFPLPKIEIAEKESIIGAGRDVSSARNLAPGKSLAEHYDPRSMSAELVAAHSVLDALVDQAFGAPGKCNSERDRQAVLFDRYAELVG